MRMLRFGLALVAVMSMGESWAVAREPLQVPAMQSALATQRPLMAVTYAGARIVAVGRMGHIVYSDNQGRSWQQGRVPVSVDLVAVFFATATRGWATGHDGTVLRTDDGGATWRKLLDGRGAARLMVEYYRPRSEGDAVMASALAEAERFVQEDGSRPLLEVWFADARHGFVIGAWGLILKTSDGGDTWEPWLHMTDNPQHVHLYGIARVGEQVWIVGEQGLVLRQATAGARFEAVRTLATGTLFGVAGNSDFTLVYGLLGRAFITRDGGATWAPAGQTGSVGLTGAAVFPDGRLLLTDVSGVLWRSDDQGMHFSRLDTLPNAGFGIVAVEAGQAAVVGAAGVRMQPVPR